MHYRAWSIQRRANHFDGTPSDCGWQVPHFTAESVG